MTKLEKQSRNNNSKIHVGNHIYRFKNPSRKNADELQFQLAEEIYDSIRDCDTDICDIAKNLGFKADNIKNVKDHIFIMSIVLIDMIQLNTNGLMPFLNKL